MTKKQSSNVRGFISGILCVITSGCIQQAVSQSSISYGIASILVAVAFVLNLICYPEDPILLKRSRTVKVYISCVLFLATYYYIEQAVSQLDIFYGIMSIIGVATFVVNIIYPEYSEDKD